MDFELPSPPSDGISSLRFHPVLSSLLLASSWDASLHLYRVGPDAASSVCAGRFKADAALLDGCFDWHGAKAYSGGLSCRAVMHDLETMKSSAIGTHSGAIKSVVHCSENSTALSCFVDSAVPRTGCLGL